MYKKAFSFMVLLLSMNLSASVFPSFVSEDYAKTQAIEALMDTHQQGFYSIKDIKSSVELDGPDVNLSAEIIALSELGFCFSVSAHTNNTICDASASPDECRFFVSTYKYPDNKKCEE